MKKKIAEKMTSMCRQLIQSVGISSDRDDRLGVPLFKTCEETRCDIFLFFHAIFIPSLTPTNALVVQSVNSNQ